jgi:hypothetical protein
VLLRTYRKVGGGPLGDAKPTPAPPPDETENAAPLPGP